MTFRCPLSLTYGAGMNLNKLAYFVAKNLVEAPRLLVLTFFFVMAFTPIVTPLIPWYTIF